MRRLVRDMGFPAGAVCALAVVVAAWGLSFPALANATVRLDEAELAQGENSVGGGTALLAESRLDMTNVKAHELFSDQSLSVNFNGGNEIGAVSVEGSADVELNFDGDNSVGEAVVANDADLTINADGSNDFEEIRALDDSSVTINLEGENKFEDIYASENASITVKGTTCQERDILVLGEGEEDSSLSTWYGDMTIDHATVTLAAQETVLGSSSGNVVIDTSKVAGGEDSEFATIYAGGTMDIAESVIDIKGTVSSKGPMTINHSDVKVEAPDSRYAAMSPYRVFSETGITLINEQNGEVKQDTFEGKTIACLDTGERDKVDLKAKGKPAYYGCDACPKPAAPVPLRSTTGDESNTLVPMAAALASAATAAFAARRREED